MYLYLFISTAWKFICTGFSNDLEFLCLKRSYTGSAESTLVKMLHRCQSHVAAQILFYKSYHPCVDPDSFV